MESQTNKDYHADLKTQLGRNFPQTIWTNASPTQAGWTCAWMTMAIVVFAYLTRGTDYSSGAGTVTGVFLGLVWLIYRRQYWKEIEKAFGEA